MDDPRLWWNGAIFHEHVTLFGDAGSNIIILIPTLPIISAALVIQFNLVMKMVMQVVKMTGGRLAETPSAGRWTSRARRQQPPILSAILHGSRSVAGTSCCALCVDAACSVEKGTEIIGEEIMRRIAKGVTWPLTKVRPHIGTHGEGVAMRATVMPTKVRNEVMTRPMRRVLLPPRAAAAVINVPRRGSHAFYVMALLIYHRVEALSVGLAMLQEVGRIRGMSAALYKFDRDLADPQANNGARRRRAEGLRAKKGLATTLEKRCRRRGRSSFFVFRGTVDAHQDTAYETGEQQMLPTPRPRSASSRRCRCAARAAERKNMRQCTAN